MSLPAPGLLTDGAVLLRPWADEDAPLLERAAREDYVALIEHLPQPCEAAAGRAWIARKRAWEAEARGWELAIVEVTSGEPIGGVGAALRHPPGVADIGIWLAADARGRGLARAAAALLATWLLKGPAGIARVQAVVEPWNARSLRLWEAAGFTREGVLRAYASRGKERADVVLFSLVARDLPAR